MEHLCRGIPSALQSFPGSIALVLYLDACRDRGPREGASRVCNRNQQEAIQALAESFPISFFSFLVLEREELPDVFWSLRIVVNLLGAVFQIVHVEIERDIVYHGLETDVIGLVWIHGLTYDDASRVEFAFACRFA